MNCWNFNDNNKRNLDELIPYSYQKIQELNEPDSKLISNPDEAELTLEEFIELYDNNEEDSTVGKCEKIPITKNEVFQALQTIKQAIFEKEAKVDSEFRIEYTLGGDICNRNYY